MSFKQFEDKTKKTGKKIENFGEEISKIGKNLLILGIIIGLLYLFFIIFL